MQRQNSRYSSQEELEQEVASKLMRDVALSPEVQGEECDALKKDIWGSITELVSISRGEDASKWEWTVVKQKSGRLPLPSSRSYMQRSPLL